MVAIEGRADAVPACHTPAEEGDVDSHRRRGSAGCRAGGARADRLGAPRARARHPRRAKRAGAGKRGAERGPQPLPRRASIPGARSLPSLREVRPRSLHRLWPLRSNVRRGPGHLRPRDGRARLRHGDGAGLAERLGRVRLRRAAAAASTAAPPVRFSSPASSTSAPVESTADDDLRLLRGRLLAGRARPRRIESPAISPTRAAPVNRGHACVKGRFAHGFARSPDRLSAPLIRRDDEPRGDELGRGARLRGLASCAGSATSTARTRSPRSPPPAPPTRRTT